MNVLILGIIVGFVLGAIFVIGFAALSMSGNDDEVQP